MSFATANHRSASLTARTVMIAIVGLFCAAAASLYWLAALTASQFRPASVLVLIYASAGSMTINVVACGLMFIALQVARAAGSGRRLATTAVLVAVLHTAVVGAVTTALAAAGSDDAGSTIVATGYAAVALAALGVARYTLGRYLSAVTARPADPRAM